MVMPRVNWLGILGLILTLLSMSAGVAAFTFARPSDVTDEVSEHVRDPTRGHPVLTHRMGEVEKALEKQGEILQRIDKNSLLIGKRWGVKGLHKDDEDE